MQCHYCHTEATFAPETGGVRVGLCDHHFRRRFEQLAQADGLSGLRNSLEIDRPENR